MLPAVAQPPQTKLKKLVRRRGLDRSQVLRRGFQAAFLLLNVWIGIEFVLFVHFCESGGNAVWVNRPPGVEGWLPVASLMNPKVWLLTGVLPALHPAGLFLLVAFLAISFLFRKAFCSWMCPIGTVSEWLWRFGRRTFGRNRRLPRAPDIPLRGLKYALLALFLYAVVSMPVDAIRAFLEGPYGVVADVKMLNFFRYMGIGTALTLAVLVVASLFVQNFWCRYLCPYGALFGLASLPGLLRIRRDTAACIDCARCAKACPSALPVDRLLQIRSAECTGCLECVAVCPAEGALALSLPRRRKIPHWAMAAGIALVFLGICGWAQWTGHWRTNLPLRTYLDLVPHAREFTHP